MYGCNSHIIAVKSSKRSDCGPSDQASSGLGWTSVINPSAPTATTVPVGLAVNLTYNGSVNAPKNAGSYEVVGVIADLNYAGSVTNALEVTPRTLSAVANNASRIFGQTNPVFTGSLIGVAVGDNITATHASEATESSPIGVYPIVPILDDPDGRLGNYEVGKTNGVLLVVGLPRFTDITRNADGTVVLTCEVFAGRTYDFQFKNDLEALAWTTFLPNYLAGATNAVIPDASGSNPQRFYRAVDVTSP